MPDQWTSAPNDPNLFFTEHSDESCYTNCGNRSGFCDYFCGVGMLCCADGSLTDALECRKARGFTRGGDYECVGAVDADRKSLRASTGADASTPTSEPYSTIETAPAGNSTFSLIIIIVGIVMVGSGMFLLCTSSGPTKSWRYYKQRQPTEDPSSADDDEPIE